MEEMTAALGPKATPTTDGTADEEDFVPKISFVRRAARGPMGDSKVMGRPGASNITGGSPGEKDVFDLADDRLDKAQTLCESGAHQFLRDGNCDEEIEGIRAAIKSVLELGTTKTERLEKKQIQNTRYESTAQEGNETRVYKPKRIRLLDAMPAAPAKEMSPRMIEIDNDNDDDAYAIYG